MDQESDDALLPYCAYGSTVSVQRASAQSIVALCAVGFFINCQPSEAYLTHYLKTVKKLSSEQLDDDVWPYDTYGSFAFLLPVGVLCEVAGYKVAIGAGLICRELTRIVLIWGTSIEAMATMQLTYAGATAANTVYFAYVYMCVAPEQFVYVTSFIHMAYYSGNAIGSLLGQLLYSYTAINTHLVGLFYVSWGFTTIGFAVFLLFFPSPIRTAPPSLVATWCNDGINALLHSLHEMYSDFVVLLWSAWWVMALGSHAMIANYYQTQFSEIDPSIGDSLGYVECVMMLLSSLASLLPALVPTTTMVSLSVPAIFSSSVLLSFLYFASTIWQSSVYYSYTFNILAISLYSCQYAAGSAVIAHQIVGYRYAILFTANSFVSFAISTVIQQVAQNDEMNTNGYFRIAAAQQLVVVLLLLLIITVKNICCTETCTERYDLAV